MPTKTRVEAITTMYLAAVIESENNMEPFKVAIFLTVVISGCSHLMGTMPAERSRRKLEKALRNIPGSDDGWQLLVFKNPNKMLSDADAPEIRALKTDFITKWNRSRRYLPITIGLMFAGVIISFIILVTGQVGK